MKILIDAGNYDDDNKGQDNYFTYANDNNKKYRER